MSKRIKEVIEVGDNHSLEALIEQLVRVRSQLPEGAEPMVKMRGDDIFGRRISISYFRPQTAEEAACDARYAGAHAASLEQQIARLQDELNEASPLRAVA